jgi:hypothetical protein
MTEFNFARRKLLARGAALAGLAVFGVSRAASAGQATVCADPNKLDSGQISLRESLNYTEMSKNPDQVCAGCGYLKEIDGNCGACDIFTGPANVKGHCDAWSARS